MKTALACVLIELRYEFSGGLMRHHKELTKRDERREMQKLMQERVDRTPERPAPNWLLRFWLVRQRRLTCNAKK